MENVPNRVNSINPRMHDVKYIFNDRDSACILILCIILLHLHLFVINEWMYNRMFQYFLWQNTTVMSFSFFYGSIILPMKRGMAASSFHSIRMKGRKAENVEKEREKEMLVAAAASTPFSVSERKALWRTSEMNDSDSPGNIPHKLGFKKRSDKPEERRSEENSVMIYSFFSWNTKWGLLKYTCFLFPYSDSSVLSGTEKDQKEP